jgi:hypothetical protein
MMRLGIKVPDTWLIPHKLPPDNPRYVPMAERYNPDFDLEAVAARVGYPLFMKPFDGGMWVGVTRIANPEELREAYESSGERLMHIQASMEDFDVFTRSLSIGPQTLVAQYDPSADGHYRYSAETDFLSPDLHHEVETISRLVNAFFRWEFNSCEVIVNGDEASPIDYANASPDIALVSLHYHFPWAIRALVAWCAFCEISERPMRINQSTADYFAIADGDLGYEEKLEAYRALSDRYFQIEEFEDFCGEALPNLDEVVVEYVESPEFDELTVRTITTEVLQPEKHEALIERSRTHVARWAADQRALT